ncbi:MAG: hypothetical protein Q9166_003893 [cf. Caloplaca sp. 2 TL-2023]
MRLHTPDVTGYGRISKIEMLSKLATVRWLGAASISTAYKSPKPIVTTQIARCASTKTEDKPAPGVKSERETAVHDEEKKAPEQKKTMAELDEELRMKMEGKSGEGGEAGLELEDGKPAAIKRGVRNNMFRLI